MDEIDAAMKYHLNIMNNHMNLMNYNMNMMNNIMNNHMYEMNNHMYVMNSHINLMNNYINKKNNQNMGNNPNMMNNQNMGNNPNMMNNQNMGNNPNMMNNQNMGNNPNMMNNQNMGNNPNMMNNQNMGNNPNMMNNQNQNMGNNPNMMNNQNMGNNPNMMNNQNMGNNPNMMNNQNQNMGNNNEEDNNRFEDVYPYINGNKIDIILEGINNRRVYIKIPTLLRKNELYYTGKKYRNRILDQCYYSKIKLYHNDILLNDDDTSIEIISNGETISMRSATNFNSLLYQTILQNNQNSPRINIIFIDFNNTHDLFCKVFPNNISIRQMFTVIFEEMNFEGNSDFIYNHSRINKEDDTLLMNFFSGYYSTIYFNDSMHEDLPGKIFIVTIQNNNDLILSFTAGTLEQISNFRRRLNQKIEYLNYRITNNPILNPGEIEINESDERTFSSIGIRDDCTCRVELSEI